MLAGVGESPLVQQPAAHLLALVLAAICWQLHKRCLGATAVGWSYDAIVCRGEWWRCVTGTFAHIDLLHLGMNLLALHSHGAIEEHRDTIYFLHVTALLCLIKGPCHSTPTIGFSGVLFGYHTLSWCQGVSLGSPVTSLIQASLLFHNASFVGHLSGIVAGCLVHVPRLDRWVPAVLSLGLMGAALLYTAAACPSIRISLPSVHRPRWLRGRTQLVGGHILRGTSAAAITAGQPATTTAGPFAGTARKLGGGSSGVRRIGGVLLPVPQRQRSASPAHPAAAAGPTASPATPPGSPAFRILRFSPEAPPTA